MTARPGCANAISDSKNVDEGGCQLGVGVDFAKLFAMNSWKRDTMWLVLLNS